MAYQKSHGLQLAENAVVKNFGVERVSVDPIVTEAGRCWFNETDKRYKFSTLDSGGAIIIRAFASFEELSDFVALLDSSAGAGKIGTTAFTSANSKVDVAAGTVQTAIEGLAADVDAQLVANDAELAAFDLQRAYDQTSPDGEGDAVIKLTTGKDLKIEDDDQSTIYFKVDSETGKVTITGDLEVTGVTTTIESTVSSGDHWNISPSAGTTSALIIEPDVGVTMASDLVNYKVVNGGSSVFRITEDGSVLADGRDIAVDGATLDTHLNGDADRHAATEISYDPTISGLTATDVKTALDEIQNTLGGSDGASISDQLGNIQIYAGAVDGLDSDPQYSSVNYVVQGTNLTAAVSKLDQKAKAHEDAIVSNDDDIANLNSALASETSNREGADSLIQAELNATQAAAGLSEAGAYVANTGTSFIDGASTLNGADLLLDAAIQGSVDAIAALNTSLSADISALQSEVNTTQAAAGLTTGGEYSANVSANYIDGATSLFNADVLLDAQVKANADAIGAEETARVAADDAIKTTIGATSSLVTSDKSSIVNAINEVSVAAGDGTDALKQAINAQKFRFTSGSPAIQHTVAHGLGSIDISVNVWVMGDDSKWRNDLVPITIYDENTVVVELTEARNVKVIIENEEDLA